MILSKCTYEKVTMLFSLIYQGKKNQFILPVHNRRQWAGYCGANLQHFKDLSTSKYQLSKIIVNYNVDLSGYQNLVDNIAHACT